MVEKPEDLGPDDHPSVPDGDPDHFEVFKGKDKQFYIRRMAGNGEEVSSSEGHRRQVDALAEAHREADPEGLEVRPAR